MSRHRNLRKVSFGDDDYDDDFSQSYDEKYSFAISPGTSEMYMYNRNSDTSNMSQFIKGKIQEEDTDALGDEAGPKEEVNPSIKTLEFSTMPSPPNQSALKIKPDEDFMFQMDKEPNSVRSQLNQKTKKDSLAVELKNKLNESSNPSSPNLQRKQQGSTPSQIRKQPGPNIATSSLTKSKPNESNRPQLPSINDLKINNSASNENMKKVDKEQLLKQYQEYTAGKDVINLVVIGHVDAGKSTLMGHLLYQLGQVSQKQIHKYKQESQKIGKGSFAFAWVLDETEEERNRGVTIDVANYKFETEKKLIYLMDAPGHKDFIPNMISGTAQADCALLVINSVTGEFESGFDSGGQTREHSLLAKSLGVTQMVVVVNKMDMCNWSQDRFNEICKKLGNFLIKQVGFKESDITFVPCSGLAGENLTKNSTIPALTSWYNKNLVSEYSTIIGGSTLLDCINRFRPSDRSIDKPLRFCISDVYKSQQTSNISLAGKLESGTVRIGDKVCIVPANESGIVKNIASNDEISLQTAFAGDSIILNLANVDINNISVGNFVCDCVNPPILASDRLKARVILFNLDLPVIKGFPVVFHYKSMNEAAIIKRLIAQIDKNTGEVVKEKPRFLTKGMSAIIEIEINKPICMELFQNYRELGRFMLRSSGTTIAAGQITEIVQGKS